MTDVQMIVEKILADSDFRSQLIANPEQTLQDMGVEPTPEILNAFDGVTEDDLRDLAEGFDPANAAA